jgi:hypothetical protein
MNLPNKDKLGLFLVFKLAQCDVFSSGTVDLLDVNLEMYKKQRDEKGSWLYLLFVVLWEVMPYTPGNLMESEVLFCNLVGKAVLGAAKMPWFVDSAYVLFHVASNNHFHIFQSKPDY